MQAAGAFRLGWAGLIIAILVGPARAGSPVVEVEEVVARGMEAHNGAGPLWCYGAPLIVRVGDDVFASVMEVGAEVPPLCNTRWRLLRRGAAGWAEVARADAYREREPCPLAWGGRLGLLLSVNPSTEAPGTQPGRCDPHLLNFEATHPDRPPAAIRPNWAGKPRFTEHSYRGLAVDPARGVALVANIDATSDAQCWTLLDDAGRTRNAGMIRFPIRACYPQLALRDGAGHILAVGDVVEPNPAWKAFKARTGPAWDYVFRRLFYAAAPDLAAGGFAEPIEVDNVDATGGELRNLDLWADGDGAAHLLYLKTNIAPRLHAEFFQGQGVVTTLEYAVAQRGRVVRRATLLGGAGRTEAPLEARLHVAADGRLHVVAAVAVAPSRARGGLEDRLIPVPTAAEPDPSAGSGIRLDLADPFATFFTAPPRGGSPPADTLDLFGQVAGSTDLRYARVRLR